MGTTYNGYVPQASGRLNCFEPMSRLAASVARPISARSAFPPCSTWPPAEFDCSLSLLCIAQALCFCPYLTLLSRLVQDCKCGCRESCAFVLFISLSLFFFFSYCFFGWSLLISDTSNGRTCGGPLISRFTSDRPVSQEYCIASRLCLWYVTWFVEKQAITSSDSSS